ncbi:MAG TPA: YdeI/OmpD-associated family protein [Gemmataceae bacterium]|nr:YdeI/OmpD-associated family protein [Gemmataceae bacterium]
MSNRNRKVDVIIRKAKQWQDEFTQLRNFALDCGLTEDLKWGQPCYTIDDKNVVLIHGFKEYCAYLFFKGALLKDPNRILTQQTENVQSARQIRFTSAAEIAEMEKILKGYIRDAIKVEKSGAKVSLKKTTEFAVPEEFQQKLDQFPGLKAAFDALTPGRQRGYLLYFSSAKQAKTREARIEKHIEDILEGKGLNE